MVNDHDSDFRNRQIHRLRQLAWKKLLKFFEKFSKMLSKTVTIKESYIGFRVEYLFKNCEKNGKGLKQKEGHQQGMSFRRKYLTIFVLL